MKFLKQMKLPYDEGMMGPMYGYQWRHFNKPYPSSEEQGIDQLKKVIEEIKADPTSRRIIMTDFNPLQVNQGVLYPCHSIVIQFYVTECDKKYYVSMSMYQRSVDLACGLPFNIASYGLLLEILANEVNMMAEDLIGNLGDVHLYSNHIEQAKEQIGREPYKKLPTLNFSPLVLAQFEHHRDTFDDFIKGAQPHQFIIEGYESHLPIKATLSN